MIIHFEQWPSILAQQVVKQAVSIGIHSWIKNNNRLLSIVVLKLSPPRSLTLPYLISLEYNSGKKLVTAKKSARQPKKVVTAKKSYESEKKCAKDFISPPKAFFRCQELILAVTSFFSLSSTFFRCQMIDSEIRTHHMSVSRVKLEFI